ncbi:hypothetical protein, partial [Alistipes finegoldii]|uniref:hypothetical protein n=1 Tax=Alistipes finegoldii TaxID=214856 RepID=UPI0025A03573
MVSADRLPAVNRLAATLPARFPVVNCLAVGSALDFGCRLPLQRLLFVRFPVVNRFAAVSAPDFGCRSPLQRLLFVRFLVVNRFAVGSAPDFWLSIAFAAISAARFWLHGFRGLPYRFCRTPVAAAVPMRSRQPRAVPGFRAVVHPNSGRVFFADCRKRCCLINLERYGRFPTQSLHYGGPDAQL